MGQSGGVHGVYNSGLYILATEIMQAATKDAKRLGIPAASTVDVAALKQSRTASRARRMRRRSGPGSYYKFTDAGARSTDAFVDVLWPQHVAEQLGLPDIKSARTGGRSPDQHVRPAHPGEGHPSGHVLGAPESRPLRRQALPCPAQPAQRARVPGCGGVDRHELRARRDPHPGRSAAAAGPTWSPTATSSPTVWCTRSTARTAAAGGAFAFNTPEAWNGYDTTTYRAAYYVRALAAWDTYTSARRR